MSTYLCTNNTVESKSKRFGFEVHTASMWSCIGLRATRRRPFCRSASTWPWPTDAPSTFSPARVAARMGASAGSGSATWAQVQHCSWKAASVGHRRQRGDCATNRFSLRELTWTQSKLGMGLQCHGHRKFLSGEKSWLKCWRRRLTLGRKAVSQRRKLVCSFVGAALGCAVGLLAALRSAAGAAALATVRWPAPACGSSSSLPRPSSHSPQRVT